MVMRGDSCSEGCGFENQHCILDGHISHLFVVKIVMLFENTFQKNKQKHLKSLVEVALTVKSFIMMQWMNLFAVTTKYTFLSITVRPMLSANYNKITT